MLFRSVAAAGKDEQGAGVGPGFLAEGFGRDELNVVAVRKEGAEVGERKVP